MGLTESKIKDLEDKNFHNLYERHEEAWLEMVENAYNFAHEHISNGREPRPDDILKALLPMLEVDEDLRSHQEENKARFKHFREYYGDYIIDKYLSEEGEEA
jgi:hypothetical protein